MLRFVAASLACALVLGCFGAEESPEARVRAVIDALEKAAEARDVGAIKPHVSESYKDGYGNDRRALLGLATAHFLRHHSVFLLVRVNHIELPEAGRAQADALVGLAGEPIHNPAALPEVHADLYRFTFTLRDEDGDWRVTSAEWHPATFADFEPD